ncbi:hypothetical protein [Micromonospora sp. KC606]|nr:hypothetical protein [Micromonospora sp. KC606]
MGDDCCGGDRGSDDDTVSTRTVWIIIGVVMLIGWGALAGILLT